MKGGEKGHLFLLDFPYRMSDKIAIKFDPQPFFSLGELTDKTELVLTMQM